MFETTDAYILLILLIIPMLFFSRIWRRSNHMRDTTILLTLSDAFPSVIESISTIASHLFFFNHFMSKQKNRTCYCNKPKSMQFAHPLNLDFTSATTWRFQNTSFMTRYQCICLACSNPFPSGSIFLGVTAIMLVHPKPLFIILHVTSEQKPFLEVPWVLLSNLYDLSTSSTYMKPWRIRKGLPPFSLRHKRTNLQPVCCLSGVKLITTSALGINSFVCNLL